MKRNMLERLPFLKHWKETFWDRLAPAMGFDTPAVQAWLEDRAARGQFLDRYRWLCDFIPGEPKAVRYRLEPLARREKAPDQHRRELFEELGWQYVCTVRKSWHIWCCDDPSAPELFTEPETEGDAYLYLLRRGRRATRWLWAAAAAILALLVWNFCSGPYLLNAVDHWTSWWITVVEWLNVVALVPVGVYAYQVFHRYIRALKLGVPQPHRGPYRRARAMSMALVVFWAVLLLTRVASILQPSSHPLEPVETFDRPVPCVTLAELGDAPANRTPEALRIQNFTARESWWVSEGGSIENDPVFVLAKYYRMWLPFQAERMAEAWVEQSAEWKGELEPLSHPDLDGAWLFRFDSGGQLLLVRRGAQLMEYQYDGELDLSGKLDVFAAALERYGEGGAS